MPSRDNILSQTAAMLLRRKQLEGYSEARELYHRAAVLIPMSDDPSRTWSSVRRVSESVCAVCAATVRRVSRKEGYTRARSFSDVTGNRSTIIRVMSGNLCRTTLLSNKSVYKTFRRRADLYYTLMAITFAVRRSAASMPCVNL